MIDFIEKPAGAESFHVAPDEDQTLIARFMEILGEASPQIVDDNELGDIVAHQQSTDQMRPDEASATRNENVFHRELHCIRSQSENPDPRTVKAHRHRTNVTTLAANVTNGRGN